MNDLLKRMFSGDRLALARVISRVEDRHEDTAAIVAELYPRCGKAQTIGVTGPPGAGKSTLVDGLITYWRKNGKKVAVIAVDPSSPFSGGSVLGDRIRMQKHYQDEGVYVRSLGTRGRHGGLSHATKEVIHVLDAAGFDRIIIETAGVGQTELDILQAAQTVLVILVPESGDSIQVMKAGLMEIADLFAVNKSDRPEAEKLEREIRNMLGLVHLPEGAWEIPVIKTQAHQSLGIDDVAQALDRHADYLQKSGQLDERRRRFLRSEIEDILSEELDSGLARAFESQQGKALLDDLLKGKKSPYEVAQKITIKK